MTMGWSSGLNLNWHKEIGSQVGIDACYMEEVFVICYNTDNAAEKSGYIYRQREKCSWLMAAAE